MIRTDRSATARSEGDRTRQHRVSSRVTDGRPVVFHLPTVMSTPSELHRVIVELVAPLDIVPILYEGYRLQDRVNCERVRCFVVLVVVVDGRQFRGALSSRSTSGGVVAVAQ